jgi:hypothetical protein
MQPKQPKAGLTGDSEIAAALLSQEFLESFGSYLSAPKHLPDEIEGEGAATVEEQAAVEPGSRDL